MEGNGDEAIAWRRLLGFLMRKSKTNNSNLVQKLIRRIQVSNIGSHLKESILLTILEKGLSEASIAEWMLVILEVLEEIYRSEGSLITAAMAAAYCSIAVECTLRYLDIEASHPSYLKTIQRIWRDRFQFMEPSASGEGSLLFSEELKQWRTDIEASLSDPQVMDRLMATLNTRRTAIKKLKDYLAEAWVKHDPSFQFGVPAPERQQQKASSGTYSVSSHEVSKIRKTIECSSSELQTLAKDPLSNSIELQIKDINPKPLMENQSEDASIPHPHPHACQDIDTNKANLNETTSDQSHVHRPGILVLSSTACTHEWDDSIDDLLGGTSNRASRFHLPSPKRTRFSPLESYKEAKITKRRKIKRWSQLEQETLTVAVDKFGKGNWKVILDSYKDVFDERTEVDLKDKWRNMTRYGNK